LPLFEKVIADRLFPQPWAAATNAGVCLRTDKRGAEAAPWLQRAITLRPDYVPAVVELGDLQISQGKPEEARATVDRFLGIGRKSADVLLVGVRAAMAQGNRAGAETYARQLRRDFSNSPQERVLPQLLSGQGNAATP
jgi:type IV pilus assembly protein PilF